MNPDSNIGELDGALHAAVHRIVHDAVPEHAMQTALDRIAAADMPRTSGRRHNWINRGVLTTAGAAAAIIAGVLFMPVSHNSSAWAQVAQALKDKRWIHAFAQRTDGQPDKRQASNEEFWLSFADDISAHRHDGRATFDDHRLGIRYEYDPSKETLLRWVIRDLDELESFRSIQAAFRNLFSGGARLGSRFGSEEIVTQNWSTRKADGRVWDELRLTLRNGSHLGEMVFLIDPGSHLPHNMMCRSFEDGTREGDLYQFDYPQEGPTDVYDLGVPRSAKLVDRVPSPELGNILSGVAASRENFDHYLAIIVSAWSGMDPSAAVTLHLVWSKGDRWRVEMGTPAPTWRESPPPPEGTDVLAWWKHRVEHFRFVPTMVCDGRNVYGVRFGPPDANGRQERHWETVLNLNPGHSRSVAFTHGSGDFMIELHGYPANLAMPSRIFTANLDPNPKDGPAGAVLVTYQATEEAPDPESSFRTLKFWLDPQHGYMTRQYEFSRLPVSKNQPNTPEPRTEMYVMEQPTESPLGNWYPTVVRRKNVRRSRDGRQMDKIDYFYLDFHAELPNALFEPRTGRSLGRK